MRSSIGGWVENSLANATGNAHGRHTLGQLARVHATQRASALIMGCLRPISWAAPASARNSRWRENQATTMAAAKPSTMSSTMVVIM
jgi:hypothetical protein